MGTFGIQGLRTRTESLSMKPVEEPYDFQGGMVYNINGDEIIRQRSPLVGPRSDIVHPEVAHAFWAAVLTAPLTTGDLDARKRHIIGKTGLRFTKRFQPGVRHYVRGLRNAMSNRPDDYRSSGLARLLILSPSKSRGASCLCCFQG